MDAICEVLFVFADRQASVLNRIDGWDGGMFATRCNGWQLRWGFVCDPCVEAEVFVRGMEKGSLSAGVYESRVIGEEYLPMISGWFRHGKQKLTGGFSSCPLYLKDRTENIDIQGGCCDNDVHEIFKCMEETVFRKAFFHAEQGERLYYACKEMDGEIQFLEPVDCLICCSDCAETIRIGNTVFRLTPGIVHIFSIQKGGL